MLQPRPSVALVGAKRAGFRYNRRDVQFDELFETVDPKDADILVKAKLARMPTPDEVARARARGDVDTAARGDDRSRTAKHDAGIPTPETVVIAPRHVASSEAPPELRTSEDLEPPAPPTPTKKKRVRSKRKPASVGDPPAQS